MLLITIVNFVSILLRLKVNQCGLQRAMINNQPIELVMNGDILVRLQWQVELSFFPKQDLNTFYGSSNSICDADMRPNYRNDNLNDNNANNDIGYDDINKNNNN